MARAISRPCWRADQSVVTRRELPAAFDTRGGLAAEGIDLGIRYGMGQWPGVSALPLFHIDLFPVCSPSYLERHRHPRTPHDLLSAVLLHIDEPNSQDADWAVWFAAMGIVTPPFMGGLRFNNYPLLIQAALNGQGSGWAGAISSTI